MSTRSLSEYLNDSMEAKKHPIRFLDLPLELQREIFSYLPFWELQKRRGVNRSWCIVTDSLNPDYPDAQSQNLRHFCQSVLTEVHYKFGSFLSLQWMVLKTWNEKYIFYPRNAQFFENNYSKDIIISNVTDFLKWNAVAHGCDYWTGVRGYTKDGKLFSTCMCCRKCFSEEKNTYDAKCTRELCKICCNDVECPHHQSKIKCLIM